MERAGWVSGASNPSCRRLSSLHAARHPQEDQEEAEDEEEQESSSPEVPPPPPPTAAAKKKAGKKKRAGSGKGKAAADDSEGSDMGAGMAEGKGKAAADEEDLDAILAELNLQVGCWVLFGGNFLAYLLSLQIYCSWVLVAMASGQSKSGGFAAPADLHHAPAPAPTARGDVHRPAAGRPWPAPAAGC